MSSIPLTVAPGILWTDETPATTSAFNLLARPVVSLDAAGSITVEHLNMSAIGAALAPTLRSENLLPAPDFPPPGWLVPAGVSVAAGTTAGNAAGWAATPTGDAVLYARADASPDAASSYAAQLNGGAGLIHVDFHTWLDSGICGVSRGVLTFSAWVYNGTAAGLRPALVVSTPTALDDQTTLVVAYSVTVPGSQEIAANAWGRVFWNIDTAAMTNWPKGARMALRFPSQLDGPSRYVQVAQVSLERGDVLTAWRAPQGTSSTDALSPGMGMEWHGATLPPGGWLWQNGQLVSRTLYPRLFAAIGTVYGAGDGTTTFAVPDRRGRAVVGVETMGATTAPGRAEILLATCTVVLSSDTIQVPVADRLKLRLGMGVYGPGIPAGATINRFSGRDGVVLSAVATVGGSPVALRFSTLGAADPETLAAASTGVATQLRSDWVLRGCGVTVGSANVTILEANLVDVGMEVTGAEIPAGTTVLAYLTPTTLVLSQNAIASNAASVLTFVDLDKGAGDAAVNEDADYRVVVNGCSLTTGNTNITCPAPARVKRGMEVIGTGVPAGTHVVNITGTTVAVSVAPTLTVAAAATLEFTAVTTVNTTAPAPAAVLACNFIIKA